MGAQQRRPRRLSTFPVAKVTTLTSLSEELWTHTIGRIYRRSFKNRRRSVGLWRNFAKIRNDGVDIGRLEISQTKTDCFRHGSRCGSVPFGMARRQIGLEIPVTPFSEAMSRV